LEAWACERTLTLIWIKPLGAKAPQAARPRRVVCPNVENGNGTTRATLHQLSDEAGRLDSTRDLADIRPCAVTLGSNTSARRTSLTGWRPPPFVPRQQPRGRPTSKWSPNHFDRSGPALRRPHGMRSCGALVLDLQDQSDDRHRGHPTNGGHNPGTVSKVGHPGGHYQVMTKQAEDRYVDPETRLAIAPQHHRSWCPPTSPG